MTLARGTADVVELLGKLPLLDAAQLAFCRQGKFADPQSLIQELLRRGWLTAYQAKRLLQGQAAQLVVGPYFILEPLGEGGMGHIFKARHPGLNQLAAVKVLRRELLADDDAVQRFLREIKLTSQLAKHPHLVHALDAGAAAGIHYLAMEYFEGIDLDRLVDQAGPLPVPQACDYIRQAALGLEHAHRHGLVHRDVKPANLLVTPRPAKLGADWGTVKVLDLGLARLQGQGTGPGRTVLTVASDVTMGTVDYMAPEQALDLRRADGRSDVYSLGCTLYFLVSGQPPFGDGPLAAKLMRHQQAKPPALQDLRPDAPAELTAIVRRMVAKDPEQRFQSPGEAAAALAQVFPPKQAHAPARLLVRPPQTPVHRLKGRSGNRRRVLSAAVALTAGAVFVGLLLAPPGAEPIAPSAPTTPAAQATKAAPAAKEPSRDLKKVYLDDMQEFDVRMGPWRFGKNGDLGASNPTKVVVNGKPARHGLSMHPPSQGAATVKYRLEKNAQTFVGVAALNDSSKSPPPCKFTVAGDGRRLWETVLRARSETGQCSIDVSNVDVLELRIQCDGKNSWAHGVWVDPYVLKP